MCSDVARVLRRDGVFLATRAHVVSGKRQLAAFLESHPVHRLAGGENAYTLTQYRSALRKAGFRHILSLGRAQSPLNLYRETPASIRLVAAGTARRILGNTVVVEPNAADWLDAVRGHNTNVAPYPRPAWRIGTRRIAGTSAPISMCNTSCPLRTASS
jgi:hypothetical protein